MQIGALAKSANGEYFQVVGDFVQPLNKCKIEAAVLKAATAERLAAPRVTIKQAATPIVIVKRRRIPVMA